MGSLKTQEELADIISTNIIRFRREHSTIKTQLQLAVAMHVSQAFIARLEGGRVKNNNKKKKLNVPNAYRLYQLAVCLDKNINDFFEKIKG